MRPRVDSKSLKFGAEEIDELLDLRYCKPRTSTLLSTPGENWTVCAGLPCAAPVGSKPSVWPGVVAPRPYQRRDSRAWNDMSDLSSPG